MSRLRAALALALAIAALVGCRGGSPAKPQEPSDAPRGARPRAAATPASGPTAGPTPAPTAAAAPALAALRKPAAASATLRGKVAVDARYAVGSGAAVIANNGAAIVASGLSGLIGANGSGVLANNGSNVIANNGGNLIANNGAALLSDKGAGLTSKAKYALAQAAQPAVGQVLPVGGAVLGLVEMRGGQLVPLGVDPDGKPVLAVFTDAAGAYEVHVPAEVIGNVLVRVRFPRAADAAADTRLAYDVLAAAKADRPADVDEDSSLATRYMLEAFAGRMREFLTTASPEETTRALTTAWIGAPPELQQLMLEIVREFRAEAEKVGLDKAPADEVQRVARRMIEAALARVDLDAVRVTKDANVLWKWPDEPALTSLTKALRALREGAAKRMAADPAAFAAAPFLAEANAGRAVPYEIKKPADIGEFLVAEYYVRDMWGSYRKARALYEFVGAREEPGTGIDQVDRISAASSAVLAALGQVLITDQDDAKSSAREIVRSWRPPPQQ